LRAARQVQSIVGMTKIIAMLALLILLPRMAQADVGLAPSPAERRQIRRLEMREHLEGRRTRGQILVGVGVGLLAAGGGVILATATDDCDPLREASCDRGLEYGIFGLVATAGLLFTIIGGQTWSDANQGLVRLEVLPGGEGAVVGTRLRF
jgi:hypothetical protein